MLFFFSMNSGWLNLNSPLFAAQDNGLKLIQKPGMSGFYENCNDCRQ